MAEVNLLEVDDYLPEYSYDYVMTRIKSEIQEYEDKLHIPNEDEGNISKYKGITRQQAENHVKELEALKNLVPGSKSYQLTREALIERYELIYPAEALFSIHQAMSDFRPDLGGAYSGFKELQDIQMGLIKETELAYNMGAMFRYNNSETGSGKTLMALAQAIISGCPTVLVCAPAIARNNWEQVFRIAPVMLEFLTVAGYRDIFLPDRILVINKEALYGNAQPEVLRTPDNTEAIVILNKYFLVTDTNKKKRESYFMMTDKFREFIGEGCFIIFDEVHKAKNPSTATSHAFGAISSEVTKSRGGCQSFIYTNDQLAGWYPEADSYPDGMEITYNSRNKGISRLLLLTSTVSDKEDKSGPARTCGLIFGADPGREIVIAQELVNDMLRTISNNTKRYNEMVSPDRRFRIKVPSQIPYTLLSAETQLDTIMNWLIPLPIFNGSISTETEFKLIVTDYFGKLPNAEDETEIADAVKRIKKLDEKAPRQANSDELASSRTYQMRIEKVLNNLFISTTEKDIENGKRVIISFRYLPDLVEVAKHFINLEVREKLNIGPPLILSGDIDSKVRPYVVNLFQNGGTKYRILLGMESVISESNSLHDIQGIPTVLKAMTSQNAVTSDQQKGRIMRVGVKSNPEYQTISAGLHYLIKFERVPGIRQLSNYKLLKNEDLNTQVIVLISKIRKAYFYKYKVPLDPSSPQGSGTLKQSLIRYYEKQASKPSQDVISDVCIRIVNTYAEATIAFQVSVGSTLISRDEKSAILAEVTNEKRIIPGVTQFIEDNALASAYQPLPSNRER